MITIDKTNINAEPVNKLRAYYADNALRHHRECKGENEPIKMYEEYEECIVDLMSDLMHLANHLGLQPYSIWRNVEDHYRIESTAVL